ncbi:unnamed protein product [Brassica rapa subsp. narinosa]
MFHRPGRAPKVDPQVAPQPQQSHQSIPPKPAIQFHMSSGFGLQ